MVFSHAQMKSIKKDSRALCKGKKTPIPRVFTSFKMKMSQSEARYLH